MDQKRAIIFVTTGNRENFEWTAFWGFNSNTKFYARQDTGEPVAFDGLEALKTAIKTKPSVLAIWVNGWEIKNDDLPKVCGSLAEGLPDHAVLIAAHGVWDLSKLAATYRVGYGSLMPGLEASLRRLVTSDQFAEAFERAWQYLLRAPVVPKFDRLEHRIKHVLDPLAIDLQGLLDAPDDKKLAYASQIIEQYRSQGEHLFLQILLDLRFLLTGKEDEVTLTFRDKQSIRLQTNLSEASLPEGEDSKGRTRRWPFQAIVNELNSEPLNTALKNIKKACAFIGEGWDPDPALPLVQFLAQLDRTIMQNAPGDLYRKAKEGIEVNGQKFGASIFIEARKKLYATLDELRKNIQ